MDELNRLNPIIEELRKSILEEVENIKRYQSDLMQLQDWFNHLGFELAKKDKEFQKRQLLRQKFESKYQEEHPWLAAYRIKLSKQLGLELSPKPLVVIDEYQVEMLKNLQREYLRITKKVENSMRNALNLLTQEKKVNHQILQEEKSLVIEKIENELHALKVKERSIHLKEQVLEGILPNKILPSCPLKVLLLNASTIPEKITFDFNSCQQNLENLPSITIAITSFLASYQSAVKKAKNQQNKVEQQLKLHPIKREYAKALFQYEQAVPKVSNDIFEDLFIAVEEYTTKFSLITSQIIHSINKELTTNQIQIDEAKKRLYQSDEAFLAQIKQKQEELATRQQVVDYYGRMNLSSVVEASRKVKK